jgi:hypothetical protein
MAEIFVRCPLTGEEISTGLTTESVMFASLPNVAMPVRCSSCGQEHKWRPKDAHLGPGGDAERVYELERLRIVNQGLERQLADANQQLTLIREAVK